MKERLSAALIAERARRGGGDPRRFPQPKMADLLGYSLRQYQRLEDANDPNLPTWNRIEIILARLELDADALFGEPSDNDGGGDGESISSLSRRLERLEIAAGDVQRLLQQIAERLGVGLPPEDRSAGADSRRAR